MISIYDEEKFMKEVVDNNELTFIYFYTPMCGTCHLAKQFLEVVEKIENVPPIYEVDINYFKVFAKEWKLESVPCFVVSRGESLLDKLYAFESVTNVYEFISRHLD